MSLRVGLAVLLLAGCAAGDGNPGSSHAETVRSGGLALVDLGAAGRLTPADQMIAGTTFDTAMWAVKDSRVLRVRRSADNTHGTAAEHFVVEQIESVTDAAGDSASIADAVADAVASDTGLTVSDSTSDDGASTTVLTGTEGTVTVTVTVVPGAAAHTVGVEHQSMMSGGVPEPAEIVEFNNTEAAGLVAAIPDLTMVGWGFDSTVNIEDGVGQRSVSVGYHTSASYETVMDALTVWRPDSSVFDQESFGYRLSVDDGLSIVVTPSLAGGVDIRFSTLG